MRNIYLASDSRARKKLLDIFGLKFRVLPSRIKEKRIIAGRSYARLVKRNAAEKARAVAKRVKHGIIIAADTIVVQDGKIYGKPGDLKEARLMLKKLCRRPQQLYTGIAVIDKDKEKILVDYEKTRVYMDSLSDQEIKNYFARVSPLDKAGSFDIQGRGALFIRRIEGCFYNVVGLPVYKLYKMLKKLDIKLFFFALSTTCCLLSTLLLSGCSTEYNVVTGEQETYIYSTDREVQMGKNIDRQVREEYKFTGDLLVQERVKEIGEKIASVCDRRDIDYHFAVLEDEEVNAVSLPGGFVYVNKGLIDKTGSDDELACVLAHEVGHIVARHSIKRLQAQQGYSILRVLVAQAPASGAVGSAADAAFTTLLLGYSREDELLADQLGARYAKLAGYNPRAMVTFLEKLQEINRRRPLRPINYFKTHPYVPDRVRVVKEELGEKISFSDYINIEQKPHE
ncbi:MAG: Maf and M48 domain-containing protein [Candidatus Omnitrophota bacterium]|jgi:septum formation protein